MSTLISQTPRQIVMEKDLVKLSKEDSVRHWIGVSQVIETQVGDTSAEEEDIRSQLLRIEPMLLTPTVRETVEECCHP